MSTEHPLRFFGTVLLNGVKHAVVGADDAPAAALAMAGASSTIEPRADTAPLPIAGSGDTFYGTLFHNGVTYAIAGGADALNATRKMTGSMARPTPGANRAPLPVLELSGLGKASPARAAREGDTKMTTPSTPPAKPDAPPARPEKPRDEDGALHPHKEYVDRINRQPFKDKGLRGMQKPDAELLKKWSGVSAPPQPDAAKEKAKEAESKGVGAGPPK